MNTIPPIKRQILLDNIIKATNTDSIINKCVEHINEVLSGLSNYGNINADFSTVTLNTKLSLNCIDEKILRKLQSIYEKEGYSCLVGHKLNPYLNIKVYETCDEIEARFDIR